MHLTELPESVRQLLLGRHRIRIEVPDEYVRHQMLHPRLNIAPLLLGHVAPEAAANPALIESSLALVDAAVILLPHPHPLLVGHWRMFVNYFLGGRNELVAKK